MFERFTDEARRVIVYAQEESRLRGDRHIGTEHLLLGVMHGNNLTSERLRDAGFDAQSARRHLEETSPAGPGPASGHIPFTPDAKRTLEDALRASKRLGQNHIASAHLLLGVLGVRDGGGVRLLVALGVDVDALASRAEELAAASEPDAPQQPGRSLEYVGGSQGDPHRIVVQQHGRLHAALVRYGRHEEGCDPQHRCTCGFAQVLAENEGTEGA